jgi:hypothetical protein
MICWWQDKKSFHKNFVKMKNIIDLQNQKIWDVEIFKQIYSKCSTLNSQTTYQKLTLELAELYL